MSGLRRAVPGDAVIERAGPQRLQRRRGRRHHEAIEDDGDRTESRFDERSRDGHELRAAELPQDLDGADPGGNARTRRFDH